MFIYNFKLTKTTIFKIILVIACILFLVFFGIATYKIISSSLDSNIKVNDNILKGEVAHLTIHNYTDILKMVHNDLEKYIGQKIKFSGYVYRAPDFAENEFVLARNMIISNQSIH